MDPAARLRGDRLRLIVIAVALLLLFALAYSLNYPSVATIRSKAESLGYIAPLIFVLIYAAASLAFIPKNLLSIAAGGVFGFTSGFLLVMVGATSGSVIAFLGSRRIGRASVERLAGGRLAQVDFHLGERPFLGVLVGRLIPVVPFTLLNYLAGLSAVRFPAYLGATVIGMIPGSLSYVALGAYGVQLRPWEFALMNVIFLALSLLLRKLAGRQNG